MFDGSFHVLLIGLADATIEVFAVMGELKPYLFNVKCPSCMQSRKCLCSDMCILSISFNAQILPLANGIGPCLSVYIPPSSLLTCAVKLKPVELWQLSYLPFGTIFTILSKKVDLARLGSPINNEFILSRFGILFPSLGIPALTAVIKSPFFTCS